MGCSKKTVLSPEQEAERAAHRQKQIQGKVAALLERGHIDGARSLRWHICMAANECGLKCPDMDAPANEIPTCHGIDLYVALKRKDFQCPRSLF